jgi:hypothetical protein
MGLLGIFGNGKHELSQARQGGGRGEGEKLQLTRSTPSPLRRPVDPEPVCGSW